MTELMRKRHAGGLDFRFWCNCPTLDDPAINAIESDIQTFLNRTQDMWSPIARPHPLRMRELVEMYWEKPPKHTQLSAIEIIDPFGDGIVLYLEWP